jgi:transcriptional regulator with XRE-family HTH domain
MTKEEAKDYIVEVLLDAAAAKGGKAELAREFGLDPSAISQWLRRKRFPVKLVPRVAQLVGKKHTQEKITRAILVQSWPEFGGQKGA